VQIHVASIHDQFKAQKDQLVNAHTTQVTVLTQENELMKKREYHLQEELKFYKDKLERQMVQTKPRGRSQQSSAAGTQQIIFHNKELVRVIEDKNLLER
jgi:ADP-glucose pyrophosphorylase